MESRNDRRACPGCGESERRRREYAERAAMFALAGVWSYSSGEYEGKPSYEVAAAESAHELARIMIRPCPQHGEEG